MFGLIYFIFKKNFTIFEKENIINFFPQKKKVIRKRAITDSHTASVYLDYYYHILLPFLFFQTNLFFLNLDLRFFCPWTWWSLKKQKEYNLFWGTVFSRWAEQMSNEHGQQLQKHFYSFSGALTLVIICTFFLGKGQQRASSQTPPSKQTLNPHDNSVSKNDTFISGLGLEF